MSAVATAVVTQDKWPTAIEFIVVIVVSGMIALGFVGALPWQNRRPK